MKTSWRSLLAQFLARSRAIGPGRQAIFTRKPPSKNLRFPGVALMSNRYNHHLAGRAKQQTRPAAPVFGCPGEFGARSRWVCKLARSSARSTPREGAKHKKPGGRWSAAGRSLRAAAARWAAAARRLLTARGAGGRWSAAAGRTPHTTRRRQT